MGLWQKMGFLNDEELGKKDDDHKPSKARQTQWSPARTPPRKALRWVIYAILLGAFVYLFIANIPTDLPIRDRRHPVYAHNTETRIPKAASKPAGARPTDRPRQPKEHETHASKATPVPEAARQPEYNGRIKFPKLASSLNAISATGGIEPLNRNIMFATASLKSAALILPVACQMGRELRNYVHFALLGPSTVDLADLREINGVDESCNIIFHDGRPDFAATSSVERLELSIARALFHINLFIHPQAILVDSAEEEDYFSDAMETHESTSGCPVISIPQGATQRLSWLTKLDSASLSAWKKVEIEILIQGAPKSSGGLIRLLNSLSSADFSAGSMPHLTIQMPNIVDPPAERFLKLFQWPPSHLASTKGARQLSIRHRVPRKQTGLDHSTVRFLESFWPSHPAHSHVLVLSPQVELSQNFFHYLKYTLLEYRYSAVAASQEWGTRLLGISLDCPSTYLNASMTFTPPAKKTVSGSMAVVDNATPFFWQAPNSHAILIMGDKWQELHNYVSRYLDVKPDARTTGFFGNRFVSQKFPEWLEHALRLSIARGYWTLYPGKGTDGSIASLHTELNHPPEEFEATVPRHRQALGTEKSVSRMSMLDSLPNGGNLPPFDDFPIVTWDGKLATMEELDLRAGDYVREMRNVVNGCGMLMAEELIPHRSTSDLFCIIDDEGDEVD